MNDHHPDCECCKLNLPFEFPEHLIEEIRAGKCVIFAGAGVSTESKLVMPWTFYEEVTKEMGLKQDISFPEAMSRYVAQPLGRTKLVKKLLDRFEYIDGWADLRNRATQFHRELSTMPYIKEVVTTNWDTYFEDHAAMRPFIYDADIAFWEASKRSVLKVHGSIENLSTIVATEEDYEACYKRLNEGLLGSILKQIFATKTCVFIGHSLRDSDLLPLIDAIKPQLGQFQRTHFFVSPFYNYGDLDNVGLRLEPIVTDGTYFLKSLKKHMSDNYCYASDEVYEELFEILMSCRSEHLEFVDNVSLLERPVSLCNIFYQDGVIHALERILDLQSSGEYSDLHLVQGKYRLYSERAKKELKSKDYLDYSYYSGFANGLFCYILLTLSDEDIDDAPDDIHFDEDGDDVLEIVSMYFHPKLEEMSRDEYIANVLEDPSVHKAALAQCIKAVKKKGLVEGMVVQRLPFG